MTRLEIHRFVLHAQLVMLCCALQQHPSRQHIKPHANTSRRNFLISACAATTTIATTIAPQNAHAGLWQKADIIHMPYDEFKELLEADQLKQVQFGSDGRSLACVDVKGISHQLTEIPDDPPLLKELYQRQVDVKLEEYKFQKKMNTVSWIEELMGADLTAEELYEYRGYKTVRANQPERSYAPSNLITGLDISRGMNENKKRKEDTRGFLQKYFN